MLGPNGAGKTTLLGALAGLVPLDARPRRARRTRARRPGGGRLRAARAAADRRRLPGLPAVPAPERARQRRLRPALARPLARRRARRGARAGWRASASPSSPRRGRASSPAARRSASRWCARWRSSRCCCCSTSRWPRSTCARAPRRGATLRDRLAEFAGVKLLVTHDPLEALALAERLIVIEHGRIVQSGTPAEVTARPRSAWVADLVGVNLFRGEAAGDRVVLDERRQPGRARRRQRRRLRRDPSARRRAAPRRRRRARRATSGRRASTSSTTTAAACACAPAAPLAIVAEVTPAAVAALALDQGGDVWVSVKATEIVVYPA